MIREKNEVLLIRPFIILFLLLLGLLLGAVVHYFWGKDQGDKLQALVMLTRDATPALGVGFDTPRVLYGGETQRSYPELPSASTLEFVYAQ